MKNNRKVNREFLNLPEFCHGADVRTIVHGNAYEIKISDCSHTATLHGCLDTKAEYENALFKVSTLQETIGRCKKDIIEAREVLVKVKTEKQAKSKAKKSQKALPTTKPLPDEDME